MMRVTLTVNGAPRTIEATPATTLLEVLREHLLLTGAKEGCGIGECGTCLVLVDGDPVPSCLMLAADAAEREVTTIEGLAADGTLDEVQEAFVEAGAFQCGFCTPGLVLATKALLRTHPGAGRDDAVRALAGVLCRCGSYPRVLAAIEILAGRTGR